MPNLYLVRGLPGSGKSTFAETLTYALADSRGGTLRFEADTFFWRDGTYKFDSELLHSAHKWCKDKTEHAMIYKSYNIIVSNTFTTEKELKPYLELAEQYGYMVTTLIVENRHGNASIHGVPEETMTKMRNRFSVKL